MTLFNIYTLGCKVNQYDSNNLRRKLVQSGLVFAPKNATIAVINTCSVTGSAIKRNKQMITRAKKENPRAKIILTGCWPKVYVDEAKGLKTDFICDIEKAESLVKEIANSQTINNCSVNNNFIDRSRYFIKIQDGCEQFCSYCVIPYARGKLKSRPMGEVIGEITEAVKNGFREIILSGIHLGLYGKDFETNQKLKIKMQNDKSKYKINLVSLLKKITKINNLGRIRLSSIEVREVSDDLIKLITKSNKICRHLHIPLQSGSSKILKQMNRPYDINYFRNKIIKIRKFIPDIAITTDVIVGFPGETEADFKKTYEFCKKINFSKIHVFSFFPHKKTPAFYMSGKVERREIEERSKILRKLSEGLEKRYKNKFKGRELEVTVDNRKIGKKLLGKTEYYFDILFDEPAKNNLQNKDSSLVGKIVKAEKWL